MPVTYTVNDQVCFFQEFLTSVCQKKLSLFNILGTAQGENEIVLTFQR